MNNCLLCKAEITNKRADAKYCCDRCRVIAYRVKKGLPNPFSGLPYLRYTSISQIININKEDNRTIAEKIGVSEEFLKSELKKIDRIIRERKENRK